MVLSSVKQVLYQVSSSSHQGSPDLGGGGRGRGECQPASDRGRQAATTNYHFRTRSKYVLGHILRFCYSCSLFEITLYNSLYVTVLSSKYYKTFLTLHYTLANDPGQTDPSLPTKELNFSYNCWHRPETWLGTFRRAW